MATSVRIPKFKDKDQLIGKNVYLPFKPNIPGKIISVSVENNQHIGQMLVAEVKFINDSIYKHEVWHLNDFDALIADHQKKLKTHTDKLAILASL
jgi:hypothetical protein